MRMIAIRSFLGYRLGVLAVVLAAVAALAGPARAGQWMQVSCVNPDGSAAGNEGWSGSASNTGYGANNTAVCGPGAPMQAILSSAVAEPVNAYELLQYQPPAGSALIGGTVDVTLSADGSGADASGVAALYEPHFAYDGSDVFLQCANGESTCPNGTYDYTAPVALPAGRGGDFFAAASCGGIAGQSCDATPNTANGSWSETEVHWAHFLLSNGAAPQGAGFGGSALQSAVRGTGHVVFTASDPGGPGVYSVGAAIDGHLVWAATPNTNGGACVPVGRDPSTGALMFDSQQPCPPTEVVDVPIPTRGLPDGRHELTVSITDAAGNISNVLDQNITTSNPQTTPKPRGARAIRAQFVIGWNWSGTTTTLNTIKVKHLPRASGVTATCTGRGCPKLRIGHVNAPQISRLLHRLKGRRFRAGDRLNLTVTQRHHRPERIRLTFRAGAEPTARLVKR